MADCLLGALDWEHPEWRGTFYPDDLPEDWQLAFYNQHWRCVAVPIARWRAASAADVAGWANETLERFRFLVETDGAGANERAKLAALGERLGAVYPPGAPGAMAAPPQVAWIEHPVDVRVWAARLSALAPGDRLFMVSRDARLDDMETLGELLLALGL
jgi:hypothetical protein